MSNGQLHDDKLFQGLHDRLSDYEAPYDGADWDAMNRSLDKLPKTNQFRWKFSLNTIGIMLGIVGLTVLGVVIAQGNGKSSTPAENRNANTTTTPDVSNPKETVTTNANTNAATTVPVTSVAVNNPSLDAGSVQEINTSKDLTQPRERKDKSNNPFRLGDQIDPMKGVVKQTSDDPALKNNHHDFKKPDVYYDIDPTTGETKPIRIKDSANGGQEIQQDSTITPAPQTSPDPAAPTDGQRIGFDH
jgi:hypothetical protein